MTKHISAIEHDGDGEDREYNTSCTCGHYVSRLRSHRDAVAARAAHKAAVADGTWQAEQDTEAARLAALKPVHDATRAVHDAREAARSARFEVVIAAQHGGDVDAALAARAEALRAFAHAEARLAQVTA